MSRKCPRVLLSNSDIIPPVGPPSSSSSSSMSVFNPCLICGCKSAGTRLVTLEEEDFLKSLLSVSSSFADEDDVGVMTMRFCPHCHAWVRRLLDLKEEMEDMVCRIKAVLKMKISSSSNRYPGPEDEDEEDDGLVVGEEIEIKPEPDDDDDVNVNNSQVFLEEDEGEGLELNEEDHGGDDQKRKAKSRRGLCHHRPQAPHQKYFCLTCAWTFHNHWHLEQHIRWNVGHVPNPDLPPIKRRRAKSSSSNRHPASKYFCLTCGKTYSTITHLDSHTQRFVGHVANPSLVIKRRRGKRKVALEKEKEEGGRILPSSSSEPNPGEAIGHKRRRRRRNKLSQVVKEQKFVCLTCGSVFEDEASLTSHLQPKGDFVVSVSTPTSDPEATVGDDSVVVPSRPPYRCEPCRKNFRRRWDFLGHVVTKSHKRMVLMITTDTSLSSAISEARVEGGSSSTIENCTLCKATLGSEILAQAHCHPDPENPCYVAYICPICQKVLKTKAVLRIHIKVVHKKARETQCQFCGDVLCTPASMRDHVLARHTSLEDQRTCPTCGKGFSDLRERIDHERVVHKGLVSFKCYFCGKIMNDSCALEKHLRTHTLERPFFCKECGKDFTDGRRLKAHVNKGCRL